jgi:hypothetical protein
MLKKGQCLLLKWMLILSYLVFMIESGVHEKTVENSHGSNYVLSRGASVVTLSPDNPPSYSPFINPGQPPKRSHFSIPFKKRGEWKLPISGFKNIAPIHSTEAAVPSALTQPPLTHHASSKSSYFFLINMNSLVIIFFFNF